MDEELSSAKLECVTLENQIELLKNSEESTLISLVKDKIVTHEELETKDNGIEELKNTISRLQMENKILLKGQC